MAASYPYSIASFLNKADGGVIDDSHINSLQEEIVAVETALGVSPTTKSATTYSSLTSEFTSLSARLDNLDAGVASTSEGIHPQYLPKTGGVLQPSGGDVATLRVRGSSAISASALFAVESASGSSTYLSVSATGDLTASGAVALGKGATIATNESITRNLRLASGGTYSGAVLESIKGSTTTASLDAIGNMSLSGDLAVAGTITVGSLSGMNHTHEDVASGGRVIPAGAMIPWAGVGAAPSGWLLCDGQTVSRSTYADLFSAIGEAYGAGDGSTTFQIPNLKGRMPVGVDTTQAEFSAIGQSGGSKSAVAAHTHTHSHTHSGVTGAMSANATHAHTYSLAASGASTSTPFPVAHGSSTATSTASPNTSNASTDHNHTFTTGAPNDSLTASTGTGSGNLQPYLTVSYLIKV